MLIKDASVLLLDEATASLDPETERDLIDRVFQLTTNRSLLMITYRPHMLTRPDAVVRLHEGRPCFSSWHSY